MLSFSITIFDQKRLDCEPLDLVKCINGTSEAISSSLLSLIFKVRGRINNAVGFSSDTCNTLFGVNRSVSVFLREAFPNIVLIKCACHKVYILLHAIHLRNCPKN